KGLEVGDVARQNGVVVLDVVLAAQVDNRAAGLQEQLLAVAVGRQLRTVARQGQAQRFGQAVHRVGGEHAGTRTAGRTGAALILGDFLVTGSIVGGDN